MQKDAERCESLLSSKTVARRSRLSSASERSGCDLEREAVRGQELHHLPPSSLQSVVLLLLDLFENDESEVPEVQLLYTSAATDCLYRLHTHLKALLRTHQPAGRLQGSRDAADHDEHEGDAVLSSRMRVGRKGFLSYVPHNA